MLKFNIDEDRSSYIDENADLNVDLIDFIDFDKIIEDSIKTNGMEKELKPVKQEFINIIKESIKK